MVLMLGRMSEGGTAGRHDVGGRVDSAPCPHRLAQNFVVVLELVVLERDLAESVLKQLPRLDLIEELEQQSTKEHFGQRLREIVAVDHMPDQVLADTIRSAIRVCKFVDRDHRIGSPRRWIPLQPLAEHVLPLHGESPVAIEYRRHLDRQQVRWACSRLKHGCRLVFRRPATLADANPHAAVSTTDAISLVDTGAAANSSTQQARAASTKG